MEEKKIFRLRDEENVTPNIPAEKEKAEAVLESVEESIDTIVFEPEDVLSEDIIFPSHINLNNIQI